MIEGRQIVCIASSWDYDPTSKHQIMRILSRRNQILWVNYHGSRRPTARPADLKDGCAALRRVACGLRRVSPSIVQLTPLVIPGARTALLERLHQYLLIAQLRRAVRTVDREARRPVQVWSFAPDVPYLVGALNEECFLYYCVDEYTQFEGFDSRRVAAAEAELINRAGIVVATSEPLRQTKSALRPDITLVRHGVDYDHFARAWQVPLAPPNDLALSPRPVFGFFGLIQHWIDRALLAEVARLRPSYSFVLIGDCKAEASELKRRDNVFMLGRRAYEDLPAYCAGFEAGLLPFVRNAMTRNINPVKLSEYLAAGLPVVSTPLPEANRFGGPVLVADTAEQFAEACDRVLTTPELADREAISRLVRHQTWASRVELLSEIVSSRSGQPLRAASKARRDIARPTSDEPEAAAATCSFS
jgi:glycosyltransferase involved in cell wall biosynthesis